MHSINTKTYLAPNLNLTKAAHNWSAIVVLSLSYFKLVRKGVYHECSEGASHGKNGPREWSRLSLEPYKILRLAISNDFEFVANPHNVSMLIEGKGRERATKSMAEKILSHIPTFTVFDRLYQCFESRKRCREVNI